MYCPTCGSEERQLSQYCRSCGTDLRSVRITLERPDSVTASAVLARDHISRAIADKIRETRSPDDLQKVAEEVLPEIEKFIESPQEKRLRRIRAGVVMAFIGLGAIGGGLIATINEPDLLVLVLPGMVAFFIGLAMVINGLLFTVPRKRLPAQENEVLAAASLNALPVDTSEFPPANMKISEREPARVSVTEHTTKHLADKR